MRDLGQIMFLIVRDASATIQVVVTEAALQEQLRLLTNETPCYFEGYLQAQQVKKRKEIYSKRQNQLKRQREKQPKASTAYFANYWGGASFDKCRSPGLRPACATN
jgi:aspartyl/asparaginyl-tRNA synthetase